MPEQHQCSKCSSIMEHVAFLIPTDIIFCSPSATSQDPFEVEVLRAGKFCSAPCFAEIWEWFYPQWLQRDRSMDG